jgi:hypothetical protein
MRNLNEEIGEEKRDEFEFLRLISHSLFLSFPLFLSLFL